MIEKFSTFKLIELPRNLDHRGNLTFLQYPDQVPFRIQRVFWTYNVPGGETRGGHAYHNQNEVIIAMSGSFDIVIVLTDGSIKRFSLNRSYFALYIPANTWRIMENFSTNALALHLSSSKYIESDYIRDFEYYKNIL